MSRIYSTPGAGDGPAIDNQSVADFFARRAEKIASLGPVQAVIYQDKQPQLAAQRDVAEKGKLLPLLQLDGTQRLLDVGCGTGRWVGDLLPALHWYHGIDACDGLIGHARRQFGAVAKVRFTTVSAHQFSLQTLQEPSPFDRILCAGVLIYMNDDEALRALECMGEALVEGGLALLREPVGVPRRLTISEHYSDDMDQVYNAIYRTHDELEALARQADFRVLKSGDVFDDPALNNRSDTRQQWLLLEQA